MSDLEVIATIALVLPFGSLWKAGQAAVGAMRWGWDHRYFKEQAYYENVCASNRRAG